jgi:hypothetical protein
MPQPANKRFVMEDNFTTQLALKAPIANPTFTGTVTAPDVSVTNVATASKLRATSTSSAITSNAGIIVGDFNAMHMGISTGAINAQLDDTSASTLQLQNTGGDTVIGAVTATTTIYGTFIPPRGYMLVQRLIYTNTSAFDKSAYPWLRAIKIICVGGGGGGGGAGTTGAGQNAIGSAGSGAAYAETFITEAAIAALAASVTLTIGAGGVAGAAGAAGGVGGDTSFGSTCIAKGGLGGIAGLGTAVGSFASGTASQTATASTGNIISPGGASQNRLYAYAASVSRPIPGGNILFSQPQNAANITTTTSAGFSPGNFVYGVGGYSGMNAQSQATAIAGGIGGAGIMIVELYA